MSSDIMKNRFA